MLSEAVILSGEGQSETKRVEAPAYFIVPSRFLCRKRKSDRSLTPRKHIKFFFADLPSTQLIMVQRQNFNSNTTRYALQLVRDFET